MKYSFKPITELLVQVLEHTGTLKPHIRAQLANYKRRWNESLATNLEVISDISEHTPGVPIILASYLADQLTSRIATPILLPTVGELTQHHLRAAVINPVAHVISNLAEASVFLGSIDAPVVSCDFETASRFTAGQKLLFESELELSTITDARAILLNQYIQSDGLSHPSLTVITHLSIAITEDESTVIVTDTPELRELVYSWLVNTPITQVWHNLLFDGKHIFHATGKLPKSYEDSQLMWATILNHVDTFKSKVGLKGLAKHVYGDWAVNSTEFSLENIYDSDLIYYANIDSMATMYVYNEALLNSTFQFQPNETPDDINSVFPVARPNQPEATHSRKYFYESVIKPLIPSFIHIMAQGITIDMDKVANLSVELDVVLLEVATTLRANPKIVEFQKLQYTRRKPKYIAELQEKKRSIEYYTKPFDIAKMDHRSYLLNYLDLLEQFPWKPDSLLPTGETKWTKRDVKHLSTLVNSPIVNTIIEDKFGATAPSAIIAMRMLATTKTNLYNRKYTEQIAAVDESIIDDFNPGSSKQLLELFEYLNIPSFKTSKTTDLPSYDRDVIQSINERTTDPDVKELTKCMIDHSYSAIIKSNFIKGFKLYTIDNSLKGNIKLFGAKSFRPTSNRINLLQLPSTGSRYAKPVKQCFIAKPGFITASSDYSALQEVTAANVTQDPNKVKIIGEGFDSHCFHATAYYPEVEQILGPDDGSLAWNKRFKSEAKTNPELGALRQASKPVSFKMMFGGMPDAHKGGAITDAIYNKFHNELYPGITKYNNEVVITQAKRTGELHMGLGCYITSDNPSRDARTLGNVAIQFYDFITLMAIPRLEQRILADSMQDDVLITATIYDAIYFEVRETPQAIQWLNNNLIELMVDPLFTEMKVPNLANLDIGPSWANQVEIPNEASLEQIEITLQQLKEN